MKKLGFFLAAVFCLVVAGSSASAQTIYNWNQTGSAAWTTSTNWTPTRTTPATNDILQFIGGGTLTATGVPTETIGLLNVSNSTTLNLQAGASGNVLTIGGTTLTDDLDVSPASALNINGANALTLNVATGAKGNIRGSMTLSVAAHRLTAVDAGGITFNSGATFTEGTAFSGNPFGTTNLNSIVFASGSTFVFIAGSNPFGATQPNSCVVFQSGSLYSHQGSGTPGFSGRTYANFELNIPATTITVTGGSAVSINDLTITAGTLNYNMTGTPGHSIKGNISVAGTLILNPLTAGTVNLNGTSVQTISGAGTLTITSAIQTVVINNSNGISLSRDVTLDTGTLTFTSGNITTGVNTLIIGSAETVNRTSGHVIGNLRKAFAGTANKTFEVGTANGFSPVTFNATAGTFPANFTISATQTAHPSVNAGTSIQRFWTLTNTTVTAADLTFQYLAGDVMGTEANYKVIRISGGTPVSFASSTVNTIAHTASVTGVTSFSDWTVGESLAPTAANGLISGTITDFQGVPVAGTVVHLSGTQNRKLITDANGNYRFDNVETNGFYTVTPTRANYGFSPGARSFSQLGNSTEATFTATPANGFINPLDTPEYFVRQHYLDFLGREPDESGFNFWSGQILECSNDAACIDRRTVNVSAAYFLSVEFQQTGGLVDRLYKASYARNPLFAEFMPDNATVARGVVVGRSGWEQQLLSNKESFIDSWVERPAFQTAFGSLSNDNYVATLLLNTGVSFTQSERDLLTSGLSGGTLSRADVLTRIAGNDNFAKARFNEAFVMMEYFGYLRRDPDDSGYQFWLNKLNQFDGNFERADMVKAFINSGEYRARFAR